MDGVCSAIGGELDGACSAIGAKLVGHEVEEADQLGRGSLIHSPRYTRLSKTKTKMHF